MTLKRMLRSTFHEYVHPSATPSVLSRSENDDADTDEVEEDDIRNRVGEYCTDRPTATVSDQSEDTNEEMGYIERTFIKPKTDLCKTCHDLREDIAGAVTEDSKLQLTQRLMNHIEQAKQERDFYKLCTEKARVELQNVERPHGKYLQSCSMPFTAVHYGFDFSHYITIPHSSQQVGALFFRQPKKVQIFGICDENFPVQTNYLIDESETIGGNGSKTHGPK